MPANDGPQGALYAVSAGLDLVSGVFGYLSSLEAASAARSRADMIRMEAEANAERYGEQARADIARTAVMYLASGVTLSGSPIDVLDKKAQLAQENMDSIRMAGAADALDQSQRGVAAEMAGRNALVGGLAAGSQALYRGFGFPGTGLGSGVSGGVSAAAMDTISRTS